MHKPLIYVRQNWINSWIQARADHKLTVVVVADIKLMVRWATWKIAKTLLFRSYYINRVWIGVFNVQHYFP